MDNHTSSPSAAPALLTTADLAARWGVSVGHLANLRSEGRGPTYCKPLGGRVLYPLAAVEAFEAARTVEAVAA